MMGSDNKNCDHCHHPTKVWVAVEAKMVNGKLVFKEVCRRCYKLFYKHKEKDYGMV